MSERRFTWDGDILFDSLELRELGNCLEARDIVDLLNELVEENEQLRQTNEALNSDYIKLYKFVRRCNLSEKEKRALWELLDE